jgi:hypothetical protein
MTSGGLRRQGNHSRSLPCPGARSATGQRKRHDTLGEPARGSCCRVDPIDNDPQVKAYRVRRHAADSRCAHAERQGGGSCRGDGQQLHAFDTDGGVHGRHLLRGGRGRCCARHLRTGDVATATTSRDDQQTRKANDMSHTGESIRGADEHFLDPARAKLGPRHLDRSLAVPMERPPRLTETAPPPRTARAANPAPGCGRRSSRAAARSSSSSSTAPASPRPGSRGGGPASATAPGRG